MNTFDVENLTDLAHELAFASDENKDALKNRIFKIAKRHQIFPGSIAPVYMRMASGEYEGFTVPAINLRGLTYNTARAAFKAAQNTQAGPLIFEIAPGELEAGQQTFAEYAGEIFLAALAERWEGQIYFQGDHFHISSLEKDDLLDVQHLCRTAVQSNFYQIDIDSSSLVNETGITPLERQQQNIEATARIVQFIRSLHPLGEKILIGAEVGEIGGQLTSTEELCFFLQTLQKSIGEDSWGLGKISVNTGTQQGGMLSKNGKLVRMPVDFELARQLSEIAQGEYDMPGIVQHGASTLKQDQLARLSESGVNEVHMATGIQNLIFDHPTFPPDLFQKMKSELAQESSTGTPQRDQQNADIESSFYNKRWMAWGKYKSELWDVPEPVKEALRESLVDWFTVVFDTLKISGKAFINLQVADEARLEEK